MLLVVQLPVQLERPIRLDEFQPELLFRSFLLCNFYSVRPGFHHVDSHLPNSRRCPVSQTLGRRTGLVQVAMECGVGPSFEQTR